MADEFDMEPLANARTTVNVRALYGKSHSPVKTPQAMPYRSPVFGTTEKLLCDKCMELMPIPLIFDSPDGVKELTVHFNEYQTAWINTAACSIAEMTGNNDFKRLRGSAILEIVRLFMLTDPVAEHYGKRKTREGRIARGETKVADWVDVIETPPQSPTTPGESVETADPATGKPDIEVIEAGDSIYADFANGDKLYGESSDNGYRDDENGNAKRKD